MAVQVRGPVVPVAVSPGRDRAAVLLPGHPRTGTIAEIGAVLADLDARPDPPRWTWWGARQCEPLIGAARAAPHRCWDVGQAHLLLAGGLDTDPGAVWALAHGLDPAGRPAPPRDDLFDLPDPAGQVVRDDGYLGARLRRRAMSGEDEDLRVWARLAGEVCERQRALLAARPRGLRTATSESGAALLALELERVGLPLDVPRLVSLLAESIGPRPRDPAQRDELRVARDRQVLRHAPGHEHTDLRNPEQVHRMLLAAGVRVPDTRARTLRPYAGTHPLVAALLTWRVTERMATTYGWAWLDEHVGTDRRLRGRWSPCDGAAGRMTAGAGLHNLPAVLRPAVCARPGRLLVRADLGQVEPRVLAAVSGDAGLAEATGSPDMYARVAQQLHCDRARAKVAMLSAMYGGSAGAATQVLAQMRRSYPVATGYLQAAAAAGEAGRPVTTFGGRTIRVRPGADDASRRAAGRFARNAVIQGAAAELFKVWALLVRDGLRDLDADIVLCLHDELLVHVRADQAQQAAQLLTSSLPVAAHHWSGGTRVPFVADVRSVQRWSQAKDQSDSSS